ncbi:MAG: hypothetical protein QG635_823, partial [Bacteroidota bacterium]|nr:hypothetical protein [Bacteroidota bacterium]
ITSSLQQKLLTKQYRNLIGNTSNFISSIHNTAKSFNSRADYLQRIFFVELQERLSEILLMRVDKIGMAHSIEARVPFLDHRIVEFAMSLPPDKKIPDGKTTKYVLKKAIENILPAEIINRKKQGFWAPVNEWMRNQWSEYVKSEILNSELMKLGIFEKEYVKNLIDNHIAGKGKYGHILFTLLSLCLWHKRFFGN